MFKTLAGLRADFFSFRKSGRECHDHGYKSTGQVHLEGCRSTLAKRSHTFTIPRQLETALATLVVHLNTGLPVILAMVRTYLFPRQLLPIIQIITEVARDGIEPPTQGFSIPCSTN